MQLISDQLDRRHVTTTLVSHSVEASEPRASQVGTPVITRRMLREPLLHFLVAGTILFGLGTMIERSTNGGTNAHQIRISASEIQRLRDVWTRQWGHGPDGSQTKNLVDDYIREEVLYREAIASGLDKDDTIVRRRLVEKMEFLSQEIASAPPAEDDLQEYFQQNREKFRIPAQIAFFHIYFSTSKRGIAADGDAIRGLAELKSHRISSAQSFSLGDPFMLQSEYPLQTQQQVKELFGDEFAGKLFGFELGVWTGPIRSSYGFHLVLVSQKLPSRLPELAEVRSQVLTDFQNHRLQTASQAFYTRLRRRYQVEIEEVPLSAFDSPRSTSSSGFQGATVTDAD